MEYITKNSDATILIGKNLSTKLKGGDIVLLHGELGAGKTTFVKGIAEGFGIDPNTVVSPTFTLLQTYDIETHLNKESLSPKNSELRTLVHIDTYRLESEEDLIEIGVEDYLGDPETVCIIEWPEKIEGLLQNKTTIEVTIKHSYDGRLVKIAPPSYGPPAKGRKY